MWKRIRGGGRAVRLRRSGGTSELLCVCFVFENIFHQDIYMFPLSATIFTLSSESCIISSRSSKSEINCDHAVRSTRMRCICHAGPGDLVRAAEKSFCLCLSTSGVSWGFKSVRWCLCWNVAGSAECIAKKVQCLCPFIRQQCSCSIHEFPQSQRSEKSIREII